MYPTCEYCTLHDDVLLVYMLGSIGYVVKTKQQQQKTTSSVCFFPFFNNWNSKGLKLF